MNKCAFLPLLLLLFVLSITLSYNVLGAGAEKDQPVINKDVWIGSGPYAPDDHWPMTGWFTFHENVNLQVSSEQVQQGDTLTVTATMSWIRADGKTNWFNGAAIGLDWGDVKIVSVSPPTDQVYPRTYPGEVGWAAPLEDVLAYKGYTSPTTFTVTFKLGQADSRVKPRVTAKIAFSQDYAIINLNKSPGFSIDDAKLVQVVKDPTTLIANKKTAICINVTSTFKDQVNANIAVSYDFGQKTYLEKGRDGKGVPILPGLNKIYLPGGPVTPGDSLPWMGPNNGNYLYWTKSGVDDQIKVIIDPENKTGDGDNTDNTFTLSKKVEESKKLNIWVVPIYFPHLSPNPQKPYTVDTLNQMRYLENLLPVSEDQFNWHQSQAMAWNGVPPTGTTKEVLKNWLYYKVVQPLTATAKEIGYDKLIIVVKDLPPLTDQISGAAIGMQREPQNNVTVIVNYAELFNEGTTAHEIAHTFHLWHPGDYGPDKANAQRYDVASRDYGKYMANIMKYDAPPRWIDEGRYESNPRETRSYTDTSVTPPVTSTVTSWNLMSQLETGADPTVIVASGFIFSNSTASVDESWYLANSSSVDLRLGGKGGYSFVMLSSSGEILGRAGFNASFTYIDEDANGSPISVQTDTAPFVLKIPYINGTNLIELRDASNKTLARKDVGLNKIKVTIGGPSTTELTGSDVYPVTWDSADQGVDKLTYSLLCSSDSGVNWVPIAINLRQKAFNWNTTGILGGSYELLVMANDGFNTGSATSKTLEIKLPLSEATLRCVASTTKMNMGETITLSGAITPTVPGTQVNLLITSPGNQLKNVTIETSMDGGYSYSFKANVIGVWSAQASWPGNEAYVNATSSKISWSVADTPILGIPGFSYASIATGVILVIVRYSITRRKSR